MTDSTAVLHTLGRDAIIDKLAARLQQLDDASLVELEMRTRPPATFIDVEAEDEDEAAAAEAEAVSRRQFLRTAVGVGAVAVVGVGWAAWHYGGLRERTRAELALGAELLKMQGLLALYEQLDKIGLDEIAGAGLVAAERILELVEKGADAVRAGLERVEASMLALDDAFFAIQDGIAWVESGVETVAGTIQRLEDTLAAILGPAQPVAQAAADFADNILGLLPFGVGDSIRQGINGMVDVITSVPELILSVNDRLLEPLRTSWFNPDPETGLLAGLLNTIVTGLFDPLEAHFLDLADLSETWQDKLSLPMQAALSDRSVLRDDILRFRQDEGI